MESPTNLKKQEILRKLGIDDVKKYNTISYDENIYEDDSKQSPFDSLTLEELLFIRENNYFQ